MIRESSRAFPLGPDVDPGEESMTGEVTQEGSLDGGGDHEDRKQEGGEGLRVKL